jgi:MFS family permease
MFALRARPCEEATIRSTGVAGTGALTVKPWVLVATILASSMAYIDESVVNVALPAIETDLAVSVVVIQGPANAYTPRLSAFLLTGGSAGELFGRRPIFVGGIVIFAAASL